jgi:hypothetical protein
MQIDDVSKGTKHLRLKGGLSVFFQMPFLKIKCAPFLFKIDGDSSIDD